MEKMKAFYAGCRGTGGLIPCPRCGQRCEEGLLVPSFELEGWYVCPSCAEQEGERTRAPSEWVILTGKWENIITKEELAEVRKALDETESPHGTAIGSIW